MAETQDVGAGSSGGRDRLADAMLLRAAEQTDDAILVMDRDGLIVAANDAFARLTGYSREASVGRDARFLDDEDLNAPEILQGLWQAVARGERWRGSVVRRHPESGAAYQCAVAVSPIQDGGGCATHVVAVQRDVTHEAERSDLLQRAQKLDLAGRLAGGLAHDFTNLLQVIAGNAEQALDDLTDEDARRASLRELLRATEQAAVLTRHLLALSRRQPLNVVPTLLNACLLDAVKNMRPLLGDGVAVTTALEEDIPPIQVDPDRIGQVLLNLCLNARDAMPDGGTITIRTQVGRVKPEEAARMGMVAGPAAGFSVSDTGTGMPPHVLEHVFEPFFTTKARDKGAGLGLATAYAIVKQHGGHMDVTTGLNAGSTFTIWLPVRTKSGAEGRVDVDLAALRGNGETLLVVEDEEAVRRILVSHLTRHGYTVLEAEDGVCGLERFRAHDREIRLIVCDVLMPRMGGIELIESIRLGGSLLPVLFVSGYADMVSDRGRALLSLPDVACLNKPVALKQLLSKVRELLNA